MQPEGEHPYRCSYPVHIGYHCYSIPRCQVLEADLRVIPECTGIEFGEIRAKNEKARCLSWPELERIQEEIRVRDKDAAFGEILDQGENQSYKEEGLPENLLKRYLEAKRQKKA